MENKFNKGSIKVIAKSKLFRARLDTGFVDSKETTQSWQRCKIDKLNHIKADNFRKKMWTGSELQVCRFLCNDLKYISLSLEHKPDLSSLIKTKNFISSSFCRIGFC